MSQYPIPNAVINVLPQVGNIIPVFFTIILIDDSFVEATITQMIALYGNITISNTSQFISLDTNPVAIRVNATYLGIEYAAVLYTKAVPQNTIPNNYARLVQKIPLGIFTDVSTNSLVGQDFYARGKMIDDYYVAYQNVFSQIFAQVYTPQLEFEYNGTVGLLSTSVSPIPLFLLLAQLSIVSLTSYDLELFMSRYINYRLGIICAVFINDDVDLTGNYWTLGIPGHTTLDVIPPETILGPDFDNLQNLNWTIFNASSFTTEFQTEITNLILRVSRADIGNIVSFSNSIHPPASHFTLVGDTYPTDPRLIYGRCLEYQGDNAFPLNIVGYSYTA